MNAPIPNIDAISEASPRPESAGTSGGFEPPARYGPQFSSQVAPVPGVYGKPGISAKLGRPFGVTLKLGTQAPGVQVKVQVASMLPFAS